MIMEILPLDMPFRAETLCMEKFLPTVRATDLPFTKTLGLKEFLLPPKGRECSDSSKARYFIA